MLFLKCPWSPAKWEKNGSAGECYQVRQPPQLPWSKPLPGGDLHCAASFALCVSTCKTWFTALRGKFLCTQIQLPNLGTHWGRMTNAPCKPLVWEHVSQRRLASHCFGSISEEVFLYLGLIKMSCKCFFLNKGAVFPHGETQASTSGEAELLVAFKCQGHTSSCQDFKTWMHAVSARTPQSTLTTFSPSCLNIVSSVINILHSCGAFVKIDEPVLVHCY